MKPSEFLLSKDENRFDCPGISITDENLELLDKRFIDKEELKDKIFNKLYDIDCLIRFETEGLETMDRDNYILNKTIKQLKKEILELLEE